MTDRWTGNTGRNTTIVRSNYLLTDWPANAPFLRALAEALGGAEPGPQLQRHVQPARRLNLAHSDSQMRELARRGNAMRLNGIDAELLTRDQIKAMVPDAQLDRRRARYPVLRRLCCSGAAAAPRATTRSPGASPAAPTRAASTSSRTARSPASAVERPGHRASRPRAASSARSKVGIAVAGHTSVLAEMAGLRLPIESHVLQALVSEPVKPMLDTVVMSGAVHAYISQSDKGELVIGGDLDGYNSYAQRGNLPVVEHVVAAICACSPCSRPAAHAAPVGRHHGHVHGRQRRSSARRRSRASTSTAAGATAASRRRPGSGWVFAHTIANDAPHPLNAALPWSASPTGH